MNYQTAAIVGGAAFVLSFVAGLFGGVPFFDMVLRALFWAAVGFGGFLGGETLLKNLIPDLFQQAEQPGEPAVDRAVDITLEDDGTEFQGGFVEEVEEPSPRARRPEAPAPAVVEPEAAPAPAAAPSAAAAPAGDEEMPEIGTFLDAFKPSEGEEEGPEPAQGPGYAEYAPVEAEPSRSPSPGVTLDGEEQDPAILAKAIQTVMKRDTQGN